MPSSSAIAWSGSSQATSVTKSPLPLSRASRAIRSARVDRASRNALIALGVKPRATIARSLVCCGGSMLSITNRCISMFSRGMPSRNRTIAVFSQLE